MSRSISIKSVIFYSLKLQFNVIYFYILSLVFGLYYTFRPQETTVSENLVPIITGICLTALGYLASNLLPKKNDLNWKESVLTVFGVWFYASLVSGIVFMLAGIPDANATEFDIVRRLVDGVYESVSGFTTAGTSIMLDIESFPRSVLLWRSSTHIIGGIGIAILSMLSFKKLGSNIYNKISTSEAEVNQVNQVTNYKNFMSDSKPFLYCYATLVSSLFVLLIISGQFFRNSSYQYLSHNLFDSLNYAFSTIGTGGFAPYNTSTGLLNSAGQIGGLQNIVSEWIVAFFMFLAGGNFMYWILLSQFKISEFLKGNLIKIYIGLVFGLSSFIAIILYSQYGYNLEQAGRYAFFNVNTIMSSTGLGNDDFYTWPILAQIGLILPFLVGGMIGSTAGGIKLDRWSAFLQYVKNKLQRKQSSAQVVTDSNSLQLYFGIWVVAGILILITSFSLANMNLGVALQTSLSHLGNIGPTLFDLGINNGPTGGYSMFSLVTKIVFIFAMLFGRFGMFVFILLLNQNKQNN